MIGAPPAQPHEVVELVERIKPLLAVQEPEVQGAVLADLLAIWLAGHHIAGDEDATRKMRAELLAEHCTAVRLLTSVNAKILGTTP
jgi:hypothetical protein